MHQDPNTQEFGFLIGYLKDGEKVLLPISLAKQVAQHFYNHLSAYERMMGKLRPRIPLKDRLAIWLLGGKREYREFKETYEDEIGDWQNFNWLYNWFMKITNDIKKAVLSENAQKGGKATVKKYGKKYMSELIKRRWAKRRKAIDKIRQVV